LFAQLISILLRYFSTFKIQHMPIKDFFRILFVLSFGFFSGHAQVLKPAKWTTETSSSNVKTGAEITLRFHAAIDNNWYLYSFEFPCEDPMKATFIFTPDKSYALVGGIEAINPLDKHDKIFECDVKIFKGTGEFLQKIKVLSAPLRIAGSYEYQVCTELTGQCVPGEGEFLFDKIKVSGSKLQAESSRPQNPTVKTTSQTQISKPDTTNIEQPATSNLLGANDSAFCTAQRERHRRLHRNQ